MAKCSCQNELIKVVRESKLANATYQTVIDSLMKERNESYISFETKEVYIKRFVQHYLCGEKQYKKYTLIITDYYENILLMECVSNNLIILLLIMIITMLQNRLPCSVWNLVSIISFQKLMQNLWNSCCLL